MQEYLDLAARRLKFVEIKLLGRRRSLTMGHRVRPAIEKSLSQGDSSGVSKAFNFVWRANRLPFGTFWGVIGWGASRGRRAVCASWGLSRICLPSLKRKLGPFPCPRLVLAPCRPVRVTWYGHRGRSFPRVRQNRCCGPNAVSRSVPSNRLVPLGDFRLDSVVFSADIRRVVSFGFSAS